jgi:hypothetical protein
MRLIPIHCEACARAALVDGRAIRQGVAVCGECGGTSHTLPGESYGLQDAALFDDLAAALRDAQPTPLNAVQLQSELAARNTAPGRGLKRIAKLLPSLAILELIVSNDPLVMRKAEGMLATLLEAIAASRSSSGVIAPAGSLRRTKAGDGLL